MNKKGIELGLNFMVVAVIVLVILIVALVLIFNTTKTVTTGTSCVEKGGICRDKGECNSPITGATCPDSEDECCKLIDTGED